jgi:hypothetical protein
MRRKRSSSLGLLAFAFGFLLLVMGGIQKYEGVLSWGPRNGPHRKMTREQNPDLFDEVILMLLGSGAVLAVGGLAYAYFASGSDPSSKRAVSDK